MAFRNKTTTNDKSIFYWRVRGSHGKLAPSFAKSICRLPEAMRCYRRRTFPSTAPFISPADNKALELRSSDNATLIRFPVGDLPSKEVAKEQSHYYYKTRHEKPGVLA